MPSTDGPTDGAPDTPPAVRSYQEGGGSQQAAADSAAGPVPPKEQWAGTLILLWLIFP